MSQPLCLYVKCDLCGADSSVRILEKEGAYYDRCNQCGFIYANPRSTDFASDNSDAFEDANQLEKYIIRSYGKKIQRVYRRALRHFQPYRVTNRVLEIGSNIGGFLFQARQRGWEPVGIEPVEKCAEYGRQKYDLNIIASTLENAALPSDSFDAVYSTAVFEHLASPSRVLQEVYRVLRPGGVVQIHTVNYDSYTQRIVDASDWDQLSPRIHLSLFTPSTLRKFCEKNRLVVLHLRTHGVRLHGKKSRGVLDRLRDMAIKFPLSVACRFTLKGDAISVLAMKPE
jgi:2-polyprenyl-3-methyl-5-hydroxy-6-metoxy-1,4-benzoquinol methylase